MSLKLYNLTYTHFYLLLIKTYFFLNVPEHMNLVFSFISVWTIKYLTMFRYIFFKLSRYNHNKNLFMYTYKRCFFYWFLRWTVLKELSTTFIAKTGLLLNVIISLIFHFAQFTYFFQFLMQKSVCKSARCAVA